MVETSRTWVWHFAATPDKLWPVLADTARFNEAARTPKYQVEETVQPDGTVLRLARLRLAGMDLEWEERPFEWVRPRSFRQRRIFRKGPFKTFGPDVAIEPEGTGSRVTYRLSASPSGLLGTLLLKLGCLRAMGAKIEPMALQAGAFAAGERAEAFDYAAPALPEGAEARITAIVAKIEAGPYGHGLAQKLADHVISAQEVDLLRMRPRALARRWAVPDRSAIELCLAAVKAGMLALRWDLLCPRCRGAKATAASLDGLPTGAHCPSCNIDYGRDFTRNVELTFHPAAAIRPILAGEYCLSGPMETSHVVLQQSLEPGERRTVAVALAPGAYRLRTLEAGEDIDLDAGAPIPELIGEDEGLRLGGVPAPGAIAFANPSRRPLTFVIESRAWVADALSAHEATTLQSFRDLFADQVLRPGDEVGIDQITLLFTDLKGSTALYEKIGDAYAYNLVRRHFAFLAEIVRNEDGAIVKTIGDAVMAAFRDPGAAMRAALAIQGRVASFNREAGESEIVIKVGLHAGPCIAVTLNDRLDYFGTTVNLAARLQQQSGGGDIVLSETLAADPAVGALIAPLVARSESARIKGFAEAVPFRRIAADADQSSSIARPSRS